jgi:hypothetical protein
MLEQLQAEPEDLEVIYGLRLMLLLPRVVPNGVARKRNFIHLSRSMRMLVLGRPQLLIMVTILSDNFHQVFAETKNFNGLQAVQAYLQSRLYQLPVMA